MARRLFGERKGRPLLPEAIEWPQLPAIPPPPAEEPNAVIPMLAFALSAGMASAADAAAAAEDELLERIAAFRAAVADSLHETSKDYQILHNLSQSDLTSCDEVTAELRRRLDGNIHYSVLGKLDEMHALVAAHVDRKE
jgi:hypothetical protein